MIVEFVPVETEEQLRQLAAMAKDIWQEYWPSHIGQAQTDYMVAKFQTLDVIREDIANNHNEYWLIRVADEMTPPELDDPKDAPQATESNEVLGRYVGYTGGHEEPETNRFFISKIYVYEDQRGKGYGSRTVDFYRSLCRERGLRAMYLTVNKHNDLAIRAYRGKGFETIDSVETDIGEGFIMDDYIMELKA